jgi:hypothetical protein
MTEPNLLLLIGIALLAVSKIGKIVNKKTNIKNTRKYSTLKNVSQNAA